MVDYSIIYNNISIAKVLSTVNATYAKQSSCRRVDECVKEKKTKG